MSKLVDNRSGAEYGIDGGGATIGRDPSNGIVLHGKAMSRFHAEIKVAGSQVYIRDVGSTYGTYLNGCRLDCQGDGLTALHHNDRITFGVNPASPEGEYDLTFSAEHAPTTAGKPAEGTVGKASKIDETKIAYEEAVGILIVKLNGTFRGPECEAMVDDVLARVRFDPRHVVIDLANVTYMNSYVFGVLIKLGEGLKVHGRELALAAAGGHVHRLLDMIGLSALFGNYPSVPEAEASLHERRRMAR